MSALAVVPRETSEVEVPDRIHSLPIEFVTVGPNVRVNVAGIEELAASIAEHGVLQPIKVRHAEAGAGYVVTWGQRRLLASQLVGKTEIPAIIDDTEQTAEQLSVEQLIENLHRADLNPIDRAAAMRAVVDSGVSQVDLARSLGLAPSTIANDLGLLEAPQAIRDLVEKGELSPSHAKALKGLAPKTQLEVAREAIRYGYSAHHTEEAVQDKKRQAEWAKQHEKYQAESNRKALEQLVDQLGNLAKKKVPLDAKVVVASWSGQGHAALVERIRDLGYTNVVEGSLRQVESRARTVGCDCKVWRVEQEYNRLAIVPGCVNEKHQRAKTAADETKRREKYALETSVHAKLEQMGPGLIGNLAEALPLLTARMLLWHALDYRLADWAEARGGKRGNPWPSIVALTDADLRVELGKAIAKAFRDRYGYHVPWGDLAAELGIETPA